MKNRKGKSADFVMPMRGEVAISECLGMLRGVDCDWSLGHVDAVVARS